LKTLAFFVTAFFCLGSSLAQSVSTVMGARQAAMGNTSAVTVDQWSLYNNIGGLGKITERSVAFSYEAVPSLVGANRMAMVISLPSKWVNVAIGSFRFGDALYSEQLLSAGFANTFGNTSLGLKISLVQYRADGFSTQRGVTLDFGGIIQLTPQLKIGAYITNLTQSSLQSKDGDRLPTQLVLGLGITPSEKAFISTELVKDVDHKPIWRTGIEYVIYKKLSVRTGYQVNPNAAFFGLGFHQNNLKIDYAIRFDQLTGAAHQASAGYVLNSKVKK
jgi:hypothetical protein